MGLLIVILIQVSAYAQETGADLSPSGNFSISIASDYHFSPWNKLNDMSGVTGEQVKFNPFIYQNTTGKYDRINGDMALRLRVGYRLFGPVRIVLTSSYFHTGSVMKLSDSYEFLWDCTADQSVSYGLNVYSIGAGVGYTHRLSNLFSLTASALGERSFGLMQFKSESSSSSGQLKSSADMKSEVWSGQASVGVRVHLYGSVSLRGAIDYRLLRFPAFTGSGSYLGTTASSTEWEAINSSAKLVESGHYLGVRFDGIYFPAPTPVPYQVDMWLPGRGWGENTAVLNLSGIGGSLGIEMEL